MPSSNTNRKLFKNQNWWKIKGAIKGIFWVPYFLILLILPFVGALIIDMIPPLVLSNIMFTSVGYIIISTVVLLYIEYYYRSSSKIIEQWRNKLEKLLLSRINTIWEILEANELLYIRINKLIKRRFISHIFCHKMANDIMDNLILSTIQWIYPLILDLRSDLATRLTEQQQILEWAKSEVVRNITGTPELLAVSEVQKARLDRQIEQFEELQRVLVRV